MAASSSTVTPTPLAHADNQGEGGRYKTNPNIFLKKIHVVPEPNMGMNGKGLLKITENVAIVFPSATSINFFKPFNYVVVVSNPLGVGKPTPSPFDASWRRVLCSIPLGEEPLGQKTE
ncbi:hypothetical protein TNCV_4552271 [Trichonephila clavipes]|nr:hypothetical protein TNCV_4552271 [Trichonephila clavipes]